MTDIICYFTGCLRIVVKGDFVERFLNMCSHHKIEIWNLISVGGEYEMSIFASDFRKLKPYLKKTNSKIKIKERKGFPFFLHKNRKRISFLMSAFVCIFLLYVSTFYLWGIEIDGNLYYADEVLLENLEEEAVICGVRKESIDCKKITQFLREKFDNITWASAYITGTKLMIHIKENNDNKTKSEQDEIGKNIIADCDGIIKNIVTRSGTPMVHSGDSIKKGDILVSGIIEVQNDSGDVVEEKQVIPDATIMAQVELTYQDKIERTYVRNEYTGKQVRCLGVETKDNFYTLGERKSSSEKYTLFYKRIKLTRNTKIWIKTLREYIEIEDKYSQKECQSLLSNQFSKFCEELNKKGVQILENNVKIYTESNRAFAQGNVTVCKEIGLKQ